MTTSTNGDLLATASASGGPATPPPIGLTINVWTDTSLRPDFEDLRVLLADVARAGFTHVELGGNGLGIVTGGIVQPARLSALRAALTDCSLRFTMHSSWSASCRVGNLADTGSMAAQRAGLLGDLAVARAIGAEVLVYHAGLLTGHGDHDALAAAMAAEREELRALGDLAGEDNILIAVENRAPTKSVLSRRSYGMRLDLVGEQVTEVDHPQVCVCLDTGHAFLAARYLGFDFLSAVRDIAGLVGHIHLADNFGRIGSVPGADIREMEMLGEGDLHLPPGWGEIPLADVLSVRFPRKPIVIVEMRYVHHFAEALATTRKLLRTTHQPVAAGSVS